FHPLLQPVSPELKSKIFSKLGYLTQRASQQTLPDTQTHTTKAAFRPPATRGTTGSPPAEMPLNSRQIFNRGRWWPAFQVARFRTTPHPAFTVALSFGAACAIQI